MPASPSLLIVPARFKTGKLYTQIATTSAGLVLGSSGDFNVTRATTATRFNSAGLIESVASGVPRLDYYTSGGTAGCPALLVEPSGNNGIFDSADTATNWTRGANLTSGYTDVIGVSGNNLTVAASGSSVGSADGRLRRASISVDLASGSTYTFSFLMKKTGSHTIGGYWTMIIGAASGNLGSGFNVSGSFSSGAIYSNVNITNRIRRVEQWGTDVYRCSETFTMTASGTLTQLAFAPIAGVTNADNSASGTTMAFAAPQLELGAIPTSFIPTTAAAVTRNADVISLSSVSGCIGQTEGTIYCEFEYKTNEAERRLIALSNGTTSDRIMVWTGSNDLRAQVEGGSITLASPITEGYHKLAFAYQQNGVSGTLFASLDGGAVVSGTSAAFPASLTDINIGKSEATATSNFFWNARIRSAALYTTRLTNAELAALTT
jgi:hypothetical protein